MPSKLPPLPKEAFDGVKEKTEIVMKQCKHFDVKIISPREIRCSCGCGWTGTTVMQLYDLFKGRI